MYKKLIIIILLLLPLSHIYSQKDRYSLVKLDKELLLKLSKENKEVVGEIQNINVSKNPDIKIYPYYLLDFSGIIALDHSSLFTRFEFDPDKMNISISQLNDLNSKLHGSKIFYDTEIEKFVFNYTYALGTDKMTLNQIITYFYRIKQELRLFQLLKK